MSLSLCVVPRENVRRLEKEKVRSHSVRVARVIQSRALVESYIVLVSSPQTRCSSASLALAPRSVSRFSSSAPPSLSPAPSCSPRSSSSSALGPSSLPPSSPSSSSSSGFSCSGPRLPIRSRRNPPRSPSPVLTVSSRCRRGEGGESARRPRRRGGRVRERERTHGAVQSLDEVDPVAHVVELRTRGAEMGQRRPRASQRLK